MDIRNFFKKRKLDDHIVDDSNLHDADRAPCTLQDISTPTEESKPSCSNTSATSDQGEKIHEEYRLDIGNYVNGTSLNNPVSDELRFQLLKDCWTPTESYDFKGKETVSGLCRSFRLQWLAQYSPWLAYSHVLKGALCRYCVLFPQKISRGVQGSFIIRSFSKYKKFHEYAKSHVNSEWHINSQVSASNFIAVMEGKSASVEQQVKSSLRLTIENNRQRLFPIVSTVIFCATHDLALRGKNHYEGNFQGLLEFRMEAGDTVLKTHLNSAPGNAKYTSVRVQEEIIRICSKVLTGDIVRAANSSEGFSVLADETTDIAGKEQMSIGVRFVDIQGDKAMIREEFIGFVPVQNRTGEGLAETILGTCLEIGLDLSKLIGQGYDGCSAMAGKEGGVQAIIKSKYPKALFVHCSSHRLNLVVNDLNILSEIRNTTGTVKAIIKFFRESSQRRSMVPHVSMLCETRWTEKHRSIRLFAENFVTITLALEKLSIDGNTKSRQNAYQLLCSSRNSIFIVCLVIISRYSSMLEPITRGLQSQQLHFLEMKDSVQEIITILHQHRKKSDVKFKRIMEEATKKAVEVDVELKTPRNVSRQVHRGNAPSDSIDEYFRRTLYIPYLDSLIRSLETRFSDENNSAYSLFKLHPLNVIKTDEGEFESAVQDIKFFYAIDNVVEECRTWYALWKNRFEKGTHELEMDLSEVITHTQLFPAIRTAVLIALAMPVTTCTIERSFSTLRRVKTWLRSTMNDERLSGLCMMSVHRQKINQSNNKNAFVERIIDIFGRDVRRMKLL